MNSVKSKHLIILMMSGYGFLINGMDGGRSVLREPCQKFSSVNNPNTFFKDNVVRFSQKTRPNCLPNQEKVIEYLKNNTRLSEELKKKSKQHSCFAILYWLVFGNEDHKTK